MGADAGSNQQVRELQKRIQQLETEGRKHTSVLEDLSSHQEELRLQNEQLRDTQTDLETARQRFEALFEFLPVGVLLLDRSGVIRELNHAVVDLIGRRKEHLLDHPALPLFDTTDYQKLSENLGAAAGGAMREMLANLRRQNGETLRVELRLAPMHTKDCKNHVYLTLLDVGKREEALSRLEESEARFRSVIEHTPHGVCITRTDGTFEYVNDAYCDIYGYTADELVGQPFTEFAGTHRVRSKDGSELVIEVAAAWFIGTDRLPRKATFVIDVTEREQREEKLRRFRHALDATPDEVFLVDQDTMKFIEVNEAAIELLGYTRSELLQMGPHDVDAQNSRQQIRVKFRKMFENGFTPPPIRTLHQRKDGSIFPVEMQIGMMRETGHQVVIGIGRDITSQIHTENELRRVNRELDQLLKARTSSLTTAHRELQLMNSVMENSLNGVTITDDSGVIQQINAAFTAETGYAPDDAIGKTPRILKSGRHDETFYQKLWAKIQTTGTWEGEIWNRRKTGEVFPEWLAIQAIYDEMGQVTNYVAVFHDLSELRKKEEEVEFSTNYDALTRLPNRLSFLERVDAAIRNARRHETSVAVAIADIDDFRRINETGGHPAGDAVLEHLAGTLRETVGDDATVARIGGDEFGVLIDGIIDQWDYLQTTDRLAAVSEKPTTIAGTSYDLTLTIGVALFPGDGDTAMTLLNNAEAALYQVKRRPRLLEAGRVGMYTAALDEALRRRISIELQMRVDLENRRFVPFYQPRIDLATGRIVGAEALARWIREDGTVVSPGEFIPLAEETGLIVRLGEVMLDNVHRDLLGSLAPFRDGLTVSFNASIKELLDPGFVERLSHRIAEGGTANTLELELTESVIMDDIDNTMPVLETIKAQGLSLAVDDFGTGYSSLYYLKRLPIDVLKIDKSFVDDIASDGNDQAIVTTIIAMGKALNLRLVAEGIETPQQREFLTTHGCTEGQGYLYGKPMDRDTFVQFLETVKGAV